MSAELNRTVLYCEHLNANARMVDFAGWEMPVQYGEGIIAEHLHTRNQASVFDICHMGEFRIKGTDAANSLDQILARAVADQKPGTCRYNFLLNDNAGILDDLIVYRLSQDEFYIVVNAATRKSDAERFRSLLKEEVCFCDESEQTAKIDLQGPESAKVLSNLGIPVEKLPPYYSWINLEIHSIPCLLSRTGYTGELGYEIYIKNEYAVKMWTLLLSQPNVKPAGLGARDTLRLEMGYPLYGHELDAETTPIEAGFGKILALDSNRKFPGAEILRNSQPKKHLVGIEFEGRRAARQGATIVLNGENVGIITSGAFAPSLSKAVAMGYISAKSGLSIGDKVEVVLERGSIVGTLSALPFYKHGTARNKI